MGTNLFANKQIYLRFDDELHCLEFVLVCTQIDSLKLFSHMISINVLETYVFTEKSDTD